MLLNICRTYFPCIRTYALADESSNTQWNHGTWSDTVEKSGSITIYAPKETRVGDTLFLFLSRSDDYLPLEINDWTRGAECFKSDNGSQECLTASDCIERDGDYCEAFKRPWNPDGNERSGKDLATVMFSRKITNDENIGCWDLDITGYDHTTWAIVTAIPYVDKNQPVRRWSGRSCDDSEQSVFPSKYGMENDVLLLSQSFDDTAELEHFAAPNGTELLGFTNGDDDAGFLYGKKLIETDFTGELQTEGPGRSACKDALLSVVVKRS